MNKTPVSSSNHRAVGYPYPMTTSRYLFLLAALFSGVVANAQNLSPAQIKQIEEIAQNIAAQSNANKQAMLDEMTVSFNAIAVGRNVRFENVIRVKKDLPPQKIKGWLDATRAEILPKAPQQIVGLFLHCLPYCFVTTHGLQVEIGRFMGCLLFRVLLSVQSSGLCFVFGHITCRSSGTAAKARQPLNFHSLGIKNLSLLLH